MHLGFLQLFFILFISIDDLAIINRLSLSCSNVIKCRDAAPLRENTASGTQARAALRFKNISHLVAAQAHPWEKIGP